MTARQDYIYPNLPRSLVEVVDICVSSISENGTHVYATRKDFIMKAIQNLINHEKVRNPSLSKKIEKQRTTPVITTTSNSTKKGGGNRVHVK